MNHAPPAACNTVPDIPVTRVSLPVWDALIAERDGRLPGTPAGPDKPSTRR